MAISSKLHPSSLLCLLICLLCVMAFFIIGIYPNTTKMRDLDKSIAELNAEAKRQELLYPVYSQLIKEIQRQPAALPLPQRTKMDRETFARIDEQFINMAQKYGVVFESAVPDATSYLEDSGQLIIHLAVHGDFFNFQKLLLDICQLPFLSSIDELGIYPHNDGKQMKLKLRLEQE